ncbi:MAG: hypothetical protein ACRD8U_23585 [Pyrinomonadaceae bacterium]
MSTSASGSDRSKQTEATPGAPIQSVGKSSALKVILWAGLIAGVLDITAASVTTLVRGGRPTRMLQSIASGVLGAASFQGGSKTIALGLM